MSARGGASGSPCGGGTFCTSSSRTSSTPSPVLPEIRLMVSGGSPSSSETSSATRSGSAPGRSILFRQGISSSPASTARYVFATVWASTPCEASTTSSAPSHAARLGLDRDPALALEVHRVEHLRAHRPRVDRVRHLEDAIGQRRLPVVDVGDDREVADVVLRGHGRQRR